MTWAKIIAGLVSFFNWLARRIGEAEAEQRGKDKAELEGRRELDRITDAADAARNRVSDDLEAIKADPRNRRRRKV